MTQPSKSFSLEAFAWFLFSAGLFFTYQFYTAERMECSGTIQSYKSVKTKDGIVPYIVMDCDKGGTLSGKLYTPTSKAEEQALIEAIEQAIDAKLPSVATQNTINTKVLTGLSIDERIIKSTRKTQKMQRAFGPSITFAGLILLMLGFQKKRGARTAKT